MRQIFIGKRWSRRKRRIMAGVTGAMLLSASMMHHHPVKAAPAWQEMIPEEVNDVLLKSGEAMQERLKDMVKDAVNQKIIEKRAEWSQEILDRLTPRSSYANPVIDVKATAYTAGVQDNGVWDEKTHLGTRVRPGIIAVDPKVIPLGSKVYLEFPDGRGQYAVAEDTGSDIRGNRIDIALENNKKVSEFGIKDVKVHILERGTLTV